MTLRRPLAAFSDQLSRSEFFEATSEIPARTQDVIVASNHMVDLLYFSKGWFSGIEDVMAKLRQLLLLALRGSH